LSPVVNVKALRLRLKLTREQFAARYGLQVETVRNWEAGRRDPEGAARSYLQAISAEPDVVGEAYARTQQS
jgi:putative transcriptional regulator